MSRIYNNDALSSLPLETIQYPGAWSPPANQSNKAGVLIEGTILNRSRHVIVDVSNQKVRYFVLYVRIRRAHRRIFESSGRETEPNFSETEKVRTGYLHSSYKLVAKETTDALTFPELVGLISYPSVLSTSTEKYNKEAGSMALWMEECRLDGVEFGNGDEVRIKTVDAGPFIQSITKLNEVTKVTCNMAGDEHVGASWTDRIFSVKVSQEATGSSGASRGKEGEGVADEEWDD